MHRFRASLGRPDTGPLAEVVQLQAARSLADALEEIYSHAEALRLGTEILIMRLPVEQGHPPEQVMERADNWSLGGVSAETFARYGDRPMHLLGSHGGKHFLTDNINSAHEEDLLAALGGEKADLIADIRRAEFDHILDHSRAVIGSAEGTILEAPSGRLVRNFIRVGNIQYNRDAIDAVFFWLLPHLERCGGVLTDTWSISSVAFNVAALAQDYFGGGPRRVELLPDYVGTTPGSEQRAREIVERLLRECPPDPRFDEFLCLVSATQSGSLRVKLETILAGDIGRFSPRYVAIFGLGDAGMEILHDLSPDPRFALLDAAQEEALRDFRIPIDPQVYFPLNFKDDQVVITRSVAEESRETIDALASHGAIQMHRDVEEGGRRRHRAIHVESERLLEVDLFVERFDALLGEIGRPPILIVCPPDNGPERLARHAQRQLAARGLDSELFHHRTLLFDGPLGPVGEEISVHRKLRDAGPEDEIIIITGAWINDASLTQYQKALRTHGYTGRTRYIVGLARPKSEAEWKRTCQRLTARDRQPLHAAQAIMTLPLPDWDDAACPWCEEQRLYGRWRRRDRSVPAQIVERRRRLESSRSTGIIDDLLLRLETLPRMELGPNSFYIGQGHSNADVFTAVASTLQRLRSDRGPERPPLGPKRFPVSTVLKPVDYTHEVWSDSILRAMMLRAARRDELVFVDPELERDRTAKARDLISRVERDEHSVMLEVFIASGQGKITLGVDHELRAQLLRLVADDARSRETVEYMLDMLEGDEQERRERALGPAATEAGGRDKDEA